MSIVMSPQKRLSLQLQSFAAAENEASPVSVRLKPAKEMDGLTGQVNIDLSMISILLTGSDSLSGTLQADLSYIAQPYNTKRDFAVGAVIIDVEYEMWLGKGN